MDLATLVGIVGGMVLMVSALFLAGSHGEGIRLGQFIDPPAAILVFGGGLCVVLTSVPLKVFLSIPRVLSKLLFNKAPDLPALVRELVVLSETARKDGLLALEAKVPQLTNSTLVLCVQMAVDGTRPEIIQEIMSSDAKAEQARHQVGKKMFELMARCGPAFGMIATLLGLILMLGNLDNPETIGPTMAMALVGTLYGAAMANMICIPCAEKLGHLSREEMLAKEIVVQGVLAIQAGDSPRVVEQRLATYLAPWQRTLVREEAA